MPAEINFHALSASAEGRHTALGYVVIHHMTKRINALLCKLKITVSSAFFNFITDVILSGGDEENLTPVRKHSQDFSLEIFSIIFQKSN